VRRGRRRRRVRSCFFRLLGLRLDLKRWLRWLLWLLWLLQLLLPLLLLPLCLLESPPLAVHSHADAMDGVKGAATAVPTPDPEAWPRLRWRCCCSCICCCCWFWLCFAFCCCCFFCCCFCSIIVHQHLRSHLLPNASVGLRPQSSPPFLRRTLAESDI
jgi:hypothetical protein